MRKEWLALMGAAERAYRDAGGHKNPENPADPYMTVLGYFNSLRELGGARRILEEEVQNTIKSYGIRKRVGEDRGLFQDRKTLLGGGGAHLARADEYGGRGAPAPRDWLP